MTVSLPNPEIRPSVDESPPEIGPNLAENQELAKAVTAYICREYWYPQEQLQMPFWNAWERIDQSWRARVAAINQIPSEVSAKSMDAIKPGRDGVSAKAQSVMPFKQMHAVTDIGEQLSFEDGIPCRAVVPEDVDEGDFYRPTAESAKAANALLRQNAEEIDLRTAYRKNYGGGFAKYGFAWALCPFEKRMEDVQISYQLGPDPSAIPMQMQQITMRHPGSTPEVVQGLDGAPMAILTERKIERFVTHFHHCAVEDVFIDPLISCDPIERQPCPIVREHVNDADIEGNPYHPEMNPFGYVNVELAVSATASHYALSQEDEAPLVEKLRYRHNISDQIGTGRREQRIKQRWTAFPILRIGPNGELDDGKGITCPQCAGLIEQGMPQAEAYAQCQVCQGSGKVHPPLKRYVCVMYGGMRQGATCIRLQELPEGMDIPLLYAADLVEDDSCSYPVSKSEIALIAVDQLTMAESQFQDSKEQTIDRGWKVKIDSPAWSVQNLNKAKKVPFDYDPKEAERLEGNQFDETATLIPYMERKDQQIQAIFGATDTLLGIISSGRRSALEIGEASNAAKNPIVLMVDRYNKKQIGGWARRALRNIEMFGDRDYIRRKTGREFFGKVQIFTAVGQEFIKRLAAEQNLRWLLQASPTIPAMQPIMPQIVNKLLSMMGISDIRVPDGGMAKGIMDAMRITSDILGSGIMSMPEPDEPHQIFMEVFSGAMKDPYWQHNAPQNLPLLAQRMMGQQQLLIQQQMAEMQAQRDQQQFEAGLNDKGGEGRGNQPKKPETQSRDAGQKNQALQG